MLAGDSDIVVRFQGGANAGHTIINDYGRFALHLLPSGVCTPGVVNILGPGVALDIEAFLTELQSLEESGVPAPKILVSERAQILMPYHIKLDEYEEERLGKNFFLNKEVQIRAYHADLLDILRNACTFNGALDLCCDHRRSFSQGLRQAEAGKCIVSHIRGGRDLDQFRDLLRGERGEIVSKQVDDLFFHD